MQNSSRHIRGCHRTISTWRRKLIGTIGLRARPARLRVGRWGERVAASHLRERGVSIIDTNWKAGGLEADIVALEKRTILVVEVKTRHHCQQRHYPAIDAITREKQHHLTTLAKTFMRNRAPLCRRIGAKQHRIDAIEVYYSRNRWGLRTVESIRWHRGLPTTSRWS